MQDPITDHPLSVRAGSDVSPGRPLPWLCGPGGGNAHAPETDAACSMCFRSLCATSLARSDGYWGTIGYYRDNGKQAGNYCNKEADMSVMICTIMPVVIARNSASKCCIPSCS